MITKDLFNNQQLLFSQMPALNEQSLKIDNLYYTNRFIVIKNVPDVEFAAKKAYEFIGSLDKDPLLSLLFSRTKLAKADKIPVCECSLKKMCQALHFDMGIPLSGNTSQTAYTYIALYFPANTTPGTAQTRLLPLKGLLQGKKDLVEKKVLDYVDNHGDGWDDTNTFRLQCFARLIDALGQHQLLDYKDKKMSEWFYAPTADESIAEERSFFAQAGISLDEHEFRVTLEPGDLLIFDNIRCVHGVLGNRRKGEIYQLMFGVESITPEEIACIRKEVIAELLKT